MIENLFSTLSDLLYGNFALANLSAFGWGILSIVLSPCHLSSIPLVIGFLTSQGKISTRKTLKLTFFFAIGILLSIALIGIITLSLGRIMGDLGNFGNYFVAIVFFVVGLYLMDIIKLEWSGLRMRATKSQGLFSALTLGLLFGIGLGPCTFAFMAPILGVVFSVSSTNLFLAVSLLASFAFGHILLIVFAGTMIHKVQDYLNWSENTKIMLVIKRICGALVILGGFYMIFK